MLVGGLIDIAGPGAGRLAAPFPAWRGRCGVARRSAVLRFLVLRLSLLPFVQGIPEVAYAGAEAACELGDLLPAENQQQDDKDQNQFGYADRAHRLHPPSRPS